MRKYSYDFVKEYVENNGDKLLSTEYKTMNDKLDFECKNGHTFSMTFSKYYYSGRRCRKCHDEQTRIKVTEVINYLKNHLPGYSIVENTYVKASEKSEFICPEGHHFKQTFIQLKYNHLCPECFKLKRELNSEIANNVFAEDGYKLIGTYVNQSEKVLVECPNGHQTKISLTKFKRGNRCPLCQHQSFKYSQEFVEEYFKSYGYTVIDEYKGNQEKIKTICPNGHTFITTLGMFKNQKCRCTQCNQHSKGEDIISEILLENNVDYIPQYRFNDCKDVKTLPFDFYLPDLNICIEFDGIQHFEPVKKFGGMEAYEKTKKHDNIKTQYCLNNNIELIRIGYLDSGNIKNILQQHQII